MSDGGVKSQVIVKSGYIGFLTGYMRVLVGVSVFPGQEKVQNPHTSCWGDAEGAVSVAVNALVPRIGLTSKAGMEVKAGAGSEADVDSRAGPESKAVAI